MPALAFEAVAEEWLRRDVVPRCRASSAYGVQRLVEHDLLPAWRGRRIDTIVKHDVLMLLDAIVDRGAPAKARRVYIHAHRLFKWCAGRGLIDVNPMVGLERPWQREQPRACAHRYRARRGVAGVNRLALRRHRPAADPDGQRVARRSAQLTWDEIQGDTIHLEGSRTKNGNGHLIPLSPPALELLSSAPRIGEKYVFTLDGTKPVSSWSRAKARLDKASGVTGWRIHDLRRTVATGMQRLGVGLQTVEAVLGHTGARAPALSASISATTLPPRSAPRSRLGGRTSRASYEGTASGLTIKYVFELHEKIERDHPPGSEQRGAVLEAFHQLFCAGAPDAPVTADAERARPRRI